jgi:hypothetical protein
MNIPSLAALLKVGPQAAYSIVHAYERVYGRLPRYDREIRVPAEVVDRIRKARELVKAREVGSYEEAFRLFKGGSLILTPDDRERIYHSLERLLEQAEALDPLLALVGYLREEVDILRSEIDQIRLVLYGAQMDQIARQDADIRKHLRPPRLLQATLAARDLQSQEGVSTPEPVETPEETPEETPGDTPKRSVWDLKWERWRKRMEKEEKEKNK